MLVTLSVIVDGQAAHLSWSGIVQVINIKFSQHRSVLQANSISAFFWVNWLIIG
jgi:hypothetical protein